MEVYVGILVSIQIYVDLCVQFFFIGKFDIFNSANVSEMLSSFPLPNVFWTNLLISDIVIGNEKKKKKRKKKEKRRREKKSEPTSLKQKSTILFDSYMFDCVD